MNKQFKLAIGASLLAAVVLSAQEAGPPMMGGGHFGHGGFGGRAKVVTGAPYSGDVSNQSVQTLADGNTITRSTSGHVARDSQGRTYSQETITGSPLAENGPVTITFISDPVAGYVYSLNSSTKTATRRTFKAPPSSTTSTNEAPKGGHWAAQNSSNVTTSDLGTRTISGLNAQGKSITHTVPAGTMGNAQPIVSTSETWYSPDLQIPVLATRTDPRMGQSTYTLTNIQRAEPPAPLFQVPSDYTVKDAAVGRGPHANFRAQSGNGSAQ